MIKNKILILIISFGLFFLFSCANPSGSGAGSSVPQSPANPEKLPAPETGNITISAKEGNDFAVTESELNGTVVLTAAQGYTNYKWYLDADFSVVSEDSVYSFTPANGTIMVFVTAKKDGVEYSATYYIIKNK